MEQQYHYKYRHGNWTDRRLGHILFGIFSGACVAVIDVFAFKGDVNLVFLAVLLLMISFTFGLAWGRYGWPGTAAVWCCVPGAHLFQYIFGYPETVLPNTYSSMAILAAFTFVFLFIGLACAIGVRKLNE